jgi:hypothetical protein
MDLKSPDNPARSPHWRIGLAAAQNCPRCGARTRRGTPCRSLAVRNRRRCRMHGGLSTGPKTVEGLERMRAAKTKHGQRTAEMEQIRAMVRKLKAEAKRLVELA